MTQILPKLHTQYLNRAFCREQTDTCAEMTLLNILIVFCQEQTLQLRVGAAFDAEAAAGVDVSEA